MSYTIGITLAPRTIPTINECLKSFRDAGFTDTIYIYAEPGEYEIEDANVEVFVNDERLGCFKNYHHMVTELLKLDVDYIWTTQDDFTMKPEAYEKVQEIEKYPQRFGYFDFNTRPRMSRFIYKRGRNSISLGWKSWATCYFFRKEVLQAVVNHPFYQTHLYTYKKNQQVDACVSETIKMLGLPTFYHNPSLSYHIGESTIDHTDNIMGEDLDVPCEPITVGVASMYERKDALEIMINSIYHQVDKINVYLNDYPEIPDFLAGPKINVYQGEDLGDVGKFYKVEEETGYYFTCDDDLAYADNYFEIMVALIERYQRKAIVGTHGIVMYPTPIQSYYKDRYVFSFKHSLASHIFVHILGTGTTGRHTSAINIKLEDFKQPNMSDIYLGTIAQQQHVPMVCVEKQTPFLKQLTVNNSIYEKRVRNDDKETQLINENRRGVNYLV